MIKFFRKRRQDLLSKGKTGKYFKYAIGEIILVVIGILIALQVNNWNTNRVDNQELQKSLENLHAEFTINEQIISKAIKANDSVIETAKRLINLMNLERELLTNENTDKLLFDIFENGNLEVTENSILEILQSNKLQKIKNDSLKKLIVEWTQKRNRIAFTGKNVSEKDEYLLKYLMKRYPLKNIDAYGVLQWKESSTIEIDKYLIFYDIEFENIIDDYLYNIVNFNMRLKSLKENVNQIIEYSYKDYDLNE
ncbi:hypothetical protein [Winogradskyella sp. SYSU M77433]|uniref:hypothetical protein n=1 Tax=Winogradskyella sp. SYSU M77433 TaxID=3042722 RepID=UPI0024809028|nr:hypothetical protein [Winogradskyella sp. SYSU M77433]MDH7912333.1 hypothetical protein [Winogradskyella sp. SYSU M77433]